MALIAILFLCCILILVHSRITKKENNEPEKTKSTNTDGVKQETISESPINKATLLFTRLGGFFLILVLCIWGLCSPVYSILFRKGYNYFSSCTDAMPKESPIFNDFSKISSAFSYYSVCCGVGAFFVYFGSAVIVIIYFVESKMEMVSKFFIFMV